MRRSLTYSLFLLAVLLSTSSLMLLAQSESIIITKTEDARLDEDALREAATPLVEQGAQVVVYLVAQGSEANFLARLQEDNLGDASGANDNVIALYAAVRQQYSEIRWGEDFDDILSPLAADMRSKHMNPHLRNKDYTAAFVAALEALQSGLNGTYEAPPAVPRSPVMPNSLSSSYPSSSSSSSTSSTSSRTRSSSNVWFIGVTGVLLFVGSIIFNWVTGGKFNTFKDRNSSFGRSSSFRNRSSSSRSSFSSSRSSGSSNRGGSSGGSWKD